jgi:hypothetical protein
VKNLLDVISEKKELNIYTQWLLLYLIGKKIAGKPLPSFETIKNFPWSESNAYSAMQALSDAGYIKGTPNSYTLDYADLAALVIPLETSGNAPKTASNMPSVSDYLKIFRTTHTKVRNMPAIVGTNDLTMMRWICRKMSLKDIDGLFKSFFSDAHILKNKAQRYGIADLQKFAERKGYIKFSAKSKV